MTGTVTLVSSVEVEPIPRSAVKVRRNVLA